MGSPIRRHENVGSVISFPRLEKRDQSQVRTDWAFLLIVQIAQLMYEYKTVVTDYEGMQEALGTYGAQGWRLVSVTPDTFRFISVGTLGLNLPSNPDQPEAHERGENRELSASYYLLIFEREAGLERSRAVEAAEEPMNFTLPEF